MLRIQGIRSVTTNETSSPILLKVIPPINEVQQQADKAPSISGLAPHCGSSSQHRTSSQPLTSPLVQSQHVSPQQLLSPLRLSKPQCKHKFIRPRIRPRKPFDKQSKVLILKAKLIILSDKYHSLRHLLRWHPDKKSKAGRWLIRRFNAVTLQMKNLEGRLQRRKTLWEIYYED
ncbi:hypothetical protein CVT26_005308 [Gymnopilus dilepis]|uniref:Uncharacterized protein n=1 Tax=Gymnopilus dilepis TaxID=231916 RepID=A0A409YVP6_9AGAR|nr:hypothetical protein CVT26_005308 [Gymnopilus dilepis]